MRRIKFRKFENPRISFEIYRVSLSKMSNRRIRKSTYYQITVQRDDFQSTLIYTTPVLRTMLMATECTPGI